MGVCCEELKIARQQKLIFDLHAETAGLLEATKIVGMGILTAAFGDLGGKVRRSAPQGRDQAKGLPLGKSSVAR